MILEAAQRSSRYAIARPAREVCWTVVGREAKYKSKSFIDTAVYRGNAGRYNIKKTGSDTYKVVDTTGALGTDILTDIERIKFDSGTFGIDDLL